jgi:hypothetical protein
MAKKVEDAAGNKAESEKYVTIKGLHKPRQGSEWKKREDAAGRVVWRAAGVNHEPLVIEIAKRINGRNVTVTRITVP